jgi:hypothetical protein
MNLTDIVLIKRIHSSMRRERAAKNAENFITSLSQSPHQHGSGDEHHFTRHSMYPIAVRLDTWLPQSELKDQSEATTPRKARQIRRKSKTHKVN